MAQPIGRSVLPKQSSLLLEYFLKISPYNLMGRGVGTRRQSVNTSLLAQNFDWAMYFTATQMVNTKQKCTTLSFAVKMTNLLVNWLA